MSDTKCDDILTIRVPSELTEKLKEKAKKSRRNLSDFVRITLEDHVKQQEENDGN